MEYERRQYLQKIIDGMWNGKIKIITGIRRCGKSYLLFNLFRRYLLSQGVSEDNIITIDMEDYGNRELRSPDSLYEHVKSKISNKKCYLLIDEIQYVKEFSDVLNGFRHIENLDTYVTGSNSKMLSSDVVTEFRGRGHEIRVHPLSFSEFSEIHKNADFNSLLEEYMTFGGLPEVVNENDINTKSEMLKGMVKNIYLRDVSEKNHAKSEKALADVFDVVSSDIGSLTNPKKISDTLTTSGCPVSITTVSNYLSMFENSFLFEKAVRYDIRGRKYISTPCKYYCEDMGLRNARVNFRQIEYTHIMENVIYNELRMRGYSVDVGSVTCRKKENGVHKSSNLEVDFVVNGWNKRYYVQSVYSMYDGTKMEKEIKPFGCIDDAFRRIVIVRDSIVPRADENGVLYIGAVEFLTDMKSLDL